MYEQQRIDNVVVRIKDKGKQENYSVDIQISEQGQVDILTFVTLLQSLKVFDQNVVFLYFDHVSGVYVRVSDDQLHVHNSCLIKENMIWIQVDSLLSDQILANPVSKISERKAKRSREKTIGQAFSLAFQWRKLYREGTFDEKGALVKINLDQAADMIGAPRKTLEDYYLLLRKGKCLQFKFKDHNQSKIGILRSYVREKNKDFQQKKQSFDEKSFFKSLHAQLTNSLKLKNEEELFNVIEEGNSDQDILFQN